MRAETKYIELDVLPQPNDTTCGPTCLHAVYRYWGDDISLDRVIAEVPPLPGGGTLAVYLAAHALRRGYRARIYTYNLQLFDPTWFGLSPTELTARLERQRMAKEDARLSLATDAYIDFLALGGELLYEDLTPALLRRFISRDIPVLTGLSATYLYGCARERDDNHYDDIRGLPSGHFVVLSGSDVERGQARVADPLHDNPAFGQQHYSVSMDRLIGAILLGIITYDANLLVLTPPGRRLRRPK